MIAAVSLWENRKVNGVSPSLILSFSLGSAVTTPSHPPASLLQSHSVFVPWPFYRGCFPTTPAFPWDAEEFMVSEG